MPIKSLEWLLKKIVFHLKSRMQFKLMKQSIILSIAKSTTSRVGLASALLEFIF